MFLKVAVHVLLGSPNVHDQQFLSEYIYCTILMF